MHAKQTIKQKVNKHEGVYTKVLVGSPSHGGDVTVYVLDINQPSLPTPFDSVLVSTSCFISVFMALSTVYSINSPSNPALSHSVPPVIFLPYWSFQLHIFYGSLLQPRRNPLWLTELKPPTN